MNGEDDIMEPINIQLEKEGIFAQYRALFHNGSLWVLWLKKGLVYLI